ncbi:MAG: AMP-binding protein [Bryobacterales bacterium]|nr:AMP-binding protein [Bryobacterales bacterium]
MNPTRAARTVPEMLAEADPARPALSGESGPAKTYGELLQLAERTRARLRRAGIGRGEPVAMVLRNGPHMAAAFIAVSAGAAAAPLHPGLRKRELLDAMRSLGAKALVVGAGCGSEPEAAAQALGIQVLRLLESDPCGGFVLDGERSVPIPPAGQARPADAALLLHTSGTTSRPKLVPLSHDNLTASAASVAKTLCLDPADRCLNIMPLFHIHGLVGVLLASLRAGACVLATTGFAPMRFFRWLEQLRPTWYSAVPTMHQAVVQRADRNPAGLASSHLRLVRSSSAALAPSVLDALEDRFACPVIESYGMTEASHQMASNPLPPKPRKPGTVGPPAGPEMAIMGHSGELLADGAVGEIVIRGPNVMAGYVDNPQANAEAFRKGWFRTGDQGCRDADGYYTITGRLKELINRGGEKISPREIDEVLLEHPDVAQVVAFAAPHAKLGEQVAAAVVPKEGRTLTTPKLRRFASQRLANYKVPRIFVFVDAIPKGPTGKLKRIGLAADLGLC